ncbi:CNH domain-containing protein [Russula aff. rugulosa BPL654]|nr:CNH domain-containing protein [Russula aff. rugulosa BPL654]
MLCAPSSNNSNEPLTANDSEVFQVVTLNSDTFIIPQRGGENLLSGKVNCSVPFTSPDGRACLAVGCAEGLWVGYRNDSQSLHRVLRLKMVTQCAMLDEFGIFLVLANKTLFAYKTESLIPFSLQTANVFHSPRKINESTGVEFFSVGSLGGRTLVIYMTKKGSDSAFRVLEPIFSEMDEGRLNSQPDLEASPLRWFRIYRDFFICKEASNVVFLNVRIAILCRKGFEIMDITDFKSVTIPQLHDPRYKKLAKRCRSCLPMGMFRSSMEEFFLCYDSKNGRDTPTTRALTIF